MISSLWWRRTKGRWNSHIDDGLIIEDVVTVLADDCDQRIQYASVQPVVLLFRRGGANRVEKRLDGGYTRDPS